MLFCPNCDNVLDISKNQLKQKLSVNFDQETPSTVSDTNSTDSSTSTDTDQNEKNNDKLIADVIEDLLNNNVISDTTFNEIKMDQIIKHKSYQQLDKKQKALVQSKISSYLDKIDDATSAYYVCNNCSYSEIIPSGTVLISKMSGNTSSNNYVNYDKLKNRMYSKILPFTRNYICTNADCPTLSTDSKIKKEKEAVFYRIPGSMQAWYTCNVCGSYWKGS